MKKLIMMIAVACIAGASQAASVIWTTGNNVKTPTAVTGIFTATNISGANYLATLSFYTAGGSPFVVATGKTDNTASALGALNATTSAEFAFSTNYKVDLVMTSTDGKWKLEVLGKSFTTQGAGNTSITFASEIAAAGKWTAVPEPTSMALLALGVAAIGLRRKFNK